MEKFSTKREYLRIHILQIYVMLLMLSLKQVLKNYQFDYLKNSHKEDDMNGMLSEESLYLTDIFIKVWCLYFLKYIFFHVSGSPAASSHCTAVCTSAYKLLLKHSFKFDMKAHSLSYSTTQTFKTISQVLNTVKSIFTIQKCTCFMRKRNGVFILEKWWEHRGRCIWDNCKCSFSLHEWILDC